MQQSTNTILRLRRRRRRSSPSKNNSRIATTTDVVAASLSYGLYLYILLSAIHQGFWRYAIPLPLNISATNAAVVTDVASPHYKFLLENKTGEAFKRSWIIALLFGYQVQQ